jgi:F0F1-type ATP synthase membrane subunit c/vacuolar-type H+-ATPase subunit K
VVSNLRRPDLLLSGITAALVGLAAGTYLGLLVAAGVKACL